MFDPIASRVSFPALEEKMLAFWREHDVFRRSVEDRPDAPLFNFYEGPPTANGNPGIHHVLARVFKDLIPRYRTMRGDRVPRKGGWDTHGLPVELEVERQLGLHSKPEIERYGVEAFNQQCRDSVFRYVTEWKRMTERIGYWVDTDHAYITYSREYVESCWWIFKTLFDHGLMFRDYRVTPHCPRCGTSLSSHEIALGYKEDTPDPSVTVLFRVDAAASASAPAALRLADGIATYVVAWTTTPWTLPGNVALAVNADAEYAVVEYGSDHPSTGRVRLILAAERALAVVPGMTPSAPDTLRGIPLTEARVWQDDTRILDTVRGSELVGLRYDPLYESREWDGVEALAFVDGRTQSIGGSVQAPDRRVVAAGFVQTDDGTGIVHIAPAFGEDDYVLGRAEGLMFLQPVGLDGCFIGGPWAGEFVKQADHGIRRDLRDRGVLLRDEQIHHTYPFCWRCDTPVLYYAKPSWYIRTTAVKDALIDGNQRIHWVPGHIRDGRFGEWLEGNIDWAVSRERYWGTPLPLWTCEDCAAVECIGSYAELRDRSAAATEIEDPHRPFIDAVTLRCVSAPGAGGAACGGTMCRTPEVADAWFDSGAMPYAQAHYPFEDADTFGSRFPADFICEAVDQTRGWFYTLHALATLLHRAEEVPDSIAYRNVICLGHILDGQGLKMSKSRGNVVDPWTVLDTQGADALRWYLYTASPPGNPRRFSTELVGEVSRRFLSTLWNTYSFFVTYANIANFDPSSAPRPEQRSDLDRWVRSELHRTVQRVTEGLDAYEPAEAARPIGEFVEQLSNWYVRRSRRRFWKSDDSVDTQAALHTLYECLTTVTRLLAPFTPFVAEAMYHNLVARVPGAPDSVHLDAWPEVDAAAIDEQLSADIALVQRMVSLGRAARQQASARVRQPLATAVLVPRLDSERAALERLADQVADELNVKSVEVSSADLDVSTIQAMLDKVGRDAVGSAAILQKVVAAMVAQNATIDGLTQNAAASAAAVVQKTFSDMAAAQNATIDGLTQNAAASAAATVQKMMADTMMGQKVVADMMAAQKAITDKLVHTAAANAQAERMALANTFAQAAMANISAIQKTFADMSAVTDRLRYSLRPNLPVLGPRFGREIAGVRAAIAAVDAATVAARMRAGEPLGIGDFDLAAGDILVSVEAAEGWAASEEAGYVVLLDTRITPALESEGLMREIIRRLQDLRREAGLEVTDRIRVAWRGDAMIGKVMADHGPTISEEVLALSLDAGDGLDVPPLGGTIIEADIEGHAVTLAVRKV